ncbi:cytochrome P450 [Annulohypoxylon moriforme]|nr:cytochrome P450 [Annulohypoxylon moriforme]
MASVFWLSIFAFLLSLFVLIAFHWLATNNGSSNRAKIWRSLPYVGVPPNGPFRWTLGAFRTMITSINDVSEGYTKFCKRLDLPFLLPSTGFGSIVVLPRSKLDLLNKPESQVVAFGVQLEQIQGSYLFNDKRLFDRKIHLDVVRNQLTKRLDLLAGPIADELDEAFRDYWGVDSEKWTTVNIWDTCGLITARAMSRVFIGLPLCRNERLLKQMQLFSTHVFLGGLILNTIPTFLRPILGPFISIPAKYYLSVCRRTLTPFVDETLRKRNTGERNGSQPDVLLWLIEKSEKGPIEDLDPDIIVQRLLILSLMSFFAPALVLSNCLLDLLASESKDEFISTIRHECEYVAQKYHGLSRKEAIDSLCHTDSAIKETLRVSDFWILSLEREVAMSEGLDIGNNFRIPAGTRMAVPSSAIHRDADIYKDPFRYNAFRFSEKDECSGENIFNGAEKELSTSTSNSFLAYGFGKNTCPGRHFASLLMKQALAYIIQNYEIECVGAVRDKRYAFNVMIPRQEVRISVRRRKEFLGDLGGLSPLKGVERQTA